MVPEPTPCPACGNASVTIAGVCPNCDQAKPDGAVPDRLEPAAYTPLKPELFNVFGDGLGIYVAGVFVAGAVILAIVAIAAVGTILAVAIVAVVLLVALGVIAVIAGMSA